MPMLGTLVNIVIAQLVAFAIIVFVLKRVLLNDTLSAVRRLREVESDLARKEEAARRKREEDEQEFARRTAEAREKLERDREAADREIARQTAGALAEAKTEGERIIREAKLSEDRIRREIASQLETQAVDLASEIFALIFGGELIEAIDLKFMDEVLAALDEIDASSIMVNPTAVKATVSRAMPADRRERLLAILREKFGYEGEIGEDIQPEILAGILLKIGELEVDGSLRARFQDAAEELKKA